MVANTKIEDLELILDRSQELEAEVERLHGDVRELAAQLEAERAKGSAATGEQGNLYVFDDEDESRAAFDEFFSAPDPHLDKVRRFLLD